MSRQTETSQLQAPNTPTIKKADSFRMFDRIYKRYDLLNRIFSMGRDIAWRNKVAKQLAGIPNQYLLDLASGTGDVAFTVLKKRNEVAYAVGCDMSHNMLVRAAQKAAGKKEGNRIVFTQGDAAQIPCAAETFHAATMAFGIRNVTDPLHVLNEIRRVLKPGGTALILEFSLPSNVLVRGFHLFYLRRVIPHVGALVSKDRHAYRYLNQTIETFPYGEDFCRMMRDAQFEEVRFTPLTFGVATLYQGTKPNLQTTNDKSNQDETG